MTEYRYGDDLTIHGTGHVDVERDSITGKVVAVWFRCMRILFTDTVSDELRISELESAAHANPSPSKIKAIIFEKHPGE